MATDAQRTETRRNLITAPYGHLAPWPVRELLLNLVERRSSSQGLVFTLPSLNSASVANVPLQLGKLCRGAEALLNNTTQAMEPWLPYVCTGPVRFLELLGMPNGPGLTV